MDSHRFSCSKAPFSNIGSIQFGIWNPDEIKKYSIKNITFSQIGNKLRPSIDELNSEKFGVLEKNQLCSVDESNLINCPGYFGHVELTKPVYNINYLSIVKKILQSINFYTSEILIDYNTVEMRSVLKEKNFSKRINLFVKYSNKIKNDKFSGEPLPTYKIDGTTIFIEFPTMTASRTFDYKLVQRSELKPEKAYEILKKISKKNCILLGFDYYNIRPNWFILYNLPVPPIYVRPYCKKNFIQRSEDDLTYKLCDIIKVNERLLKVIIAKKPISLVNHYRELLAYHVSTYFDNSSLKLPISTQTSGRPIKGIVQRLNGKFGRLRRNLMGKRVDFTGRTVITGDSYINLDELGIPKIISKKLTIPTIVHKFNIERMSTLVDSISKDLKANSILKGYNKKIDLRYKSATSIILLKYGFIIEKHLEDGDVLILNRQPSLHKMSMMGHKIKILPYLTFRLNLSVTTPYNADFDGDEMNIHVPQTILTKIESMMIMTVVENIMSPQANKPVIGIVQDSMISSYDLFRKDNFLTKKSLNIVSTFDKLRGYNKKHPSIIKPKMLWSGKQSINYMTTKTSFIIKNIKENDVLWKEINPEDSLIYMFKGNLMMGRLTKKNIGPSYNSIIQNLWTDYSKNESKKVINNLQYSTKQWIFLKGFSVSLADLFLDVSMIEIYCTSIENIEKLWLKELRSTFLYDLKFFFGKNKQQYLKVKTINEEIKKFDKILSYYLNKGNLNANSLINMMKSGSKGSEINLMQIIGLLGQQSLVLSEFSRDYKARLFSHYTFFEIPLEIKGYIKNNFLKGLSPYEFFFHSIAGREGIIDTSIKTAETGYIQRKLSKSMENVISYYDGSVRNSKNFIIQFVYGEDGFDPTLIEEISCVENNKNFFMKIFLNNKKCFNFNILCNNKINCKNFYKDKNNVLGIDGFFYHNIINIIKRKKNFLIKKKFYLPLNIEKIIFRSKMFFTDRALKQTVCDNNLLALFLNTLIKVLILRTNGVIFNNFKNNFINFSLLVYIIRFIDWGNYKKSNITPSSLLWILHKIEKKILKSLICPGLCLGVIAAQSIGEPTTQMTLNTFHHAGILDKNVTVGVPRFNEIINVSKNIKHTIVNVCLTSQNSLEFESSKFIISRIKYRKFIDILSNIEVLYLNYIKIDDRINNINFFKMPLMNVFLNYNGKDAFVNLIFTLYFDRLKLNNLNLSMVEIIAKITYHYKFKVYIISTSDNIKNIYLQIFYFKSKKINSIIKKYKKFENIINFIINDILEIPLFGIAGAREVGISNNIRTISYNEKNIFKKIENQLFLDLYDCKVLDV